MKYLFGFRKLFITLFILISTFFLYIFRPDFLAEHLVKVWVPVGTGYLAANIISKYGDKILDFLKNRKKRKKK